jgi:hypothetical protein
MSNVVYPESHAQGKSKLHVDLIAKVMRQLPGLPEPLIMALLAPPHHPVSEDAQRLANEYGRAVAIVTMDGQLLAYRLPQ